MNKMNLLFVGLLTFDIYWMASGFSLNPPGGSSAVGDPAPGRSPGPPDLPTIADEVGKVGDDVLSSCELAGTFKEADDVGVDLNLTLDHPLFVTVELVQGVIYQVSLSSSHFSPTSISFSLSSTIDNHSIGEFLNAAHDVDHGVVEKQKCESHVFRGQLIAEKPLRLNWTFHESKEENKKNNVTFRLNYTPKGEPFVYTKIYTATILPDCQLHLNPQEGTVANKDLPPLPTTGCQVWFPSQESGHGLVIELTRLNVPCSKGFVHFSGLNTSQHQIHIEKGYGHYKSHKQTHLCGKLEELSDNERHIYFPSSHTRPFMHLQGGPIFSISYRFVDYCYNVTFTTRNGSYELKPNGDLQCTFKIFLPYGYRVALKLMIGDNTSSGSPETGLLLQDSQYADQNCDGLLAHLQDGSSSWTHCTHPGDAERHIEIVSRENRIVLKVKSRGSKGASLGMRISYRAESIESIVGVCDFGWVKLRQFCVAAFEGIRLPWSQAEMECIRKGGHLVSIRSQQDQEIVNRLLLNSPGYRDHNAYWIGASDKTHEGDFRWSDGLHFSYTNWFPGWAQHGHYNKQPNDDGLSNQDCIEVRRIYTLPATTNSVRLANTFMWNDRDCSAPNYFICERLQNDEPLEDSWAIDCNKTVTLSRDHPKTSVSSPGFPRQYPDNANCDIDINASPGYRIILDFEELVLENEPSCSYDYLIILENSGSLETLPSPSKNSSRRLCGDWSSKLKLIRYVSEGSRIKLRFSSDYSHHYGGFKARVTMENALQCSDDRFIMFNNSCYLIIDYPEVPWNTSQQICHSSKASLASLLTSEEEKFVISSIRKAADYRTSVLYWLGARSYRGSPFKWIDNNPMVYKGWTPGQVPSENDVRGHIEEESCLSLQWTPSPGPLLPSGLYWKVQRCDSVGGFVCKRHNQVHGININYNKTLNGSAGSFSTPNYHGRYFNNLDFEVKIVGPDKTRIFIKFNQIDIEYQPECLYDFIEIKSVYKSRKGPLDAVKICGSHNNNMDRFDFVSETNVATLRFHSDYSISGNGFSLSWEAIDVSACPSHTLTAKEGMFTSPNYPKFLLAHLDCTINILAPTGMRIWLEFSQEEQNIATEDVTLELKLGKRSMTLKPFQVEELLTEGSFVSIDERLILRLKTGDHPLGSGFKACYKIIGPVKEEKNIFLTNTTSGSLLHLNYPDSPPSYTDFLQHFLAPLGTIISLELYNVKISDTECLDGKGSLEVYDKYSDTNGTLWRLCYDEDIEDNIIAPIKISSFLNTLHLRQKNELTGIPLNGSLKVLYDGKYLQKLKNRKEKEVESCEPNPCQNGGRCMMKQGKKYCQCTGYYTGLFCTLTKCQLDPCAFGTCQLTDTTYKCHCKSGYTGPTCDQKRRPCQGNPCESRGTCIEKGDSFQCQCHAWWEGPRCEKRMLHIPYKPLSERMLHEPFWLGLMTVFVVMGVIGLFWCAKRHFPEKIEKLMAEEDTRNRGTISSLRSSSVREQLAAASAAVSATNSAAPAPSPGPGSNPPRTLFGRLGIRKPSILSLTSPHASSGGYQPATARTFSLDDLLKPPPRRTPSPKKKRNNSTPTKKNAAEKKQILQQLVSPVINTRKVSLGELIQLNDIKSAPSIEKEHSIKAIETKFSDPTVQSALSDPKLEKKVTFARLLNKVSAEMSSGSDMEIGIMQTNKLTLGMFTRPSSTPPSPSVEARSPNSTSSNQGSDSFTSSELAIPSALSSSVSDLLINRRHNRLPNGRLKPASADSILAMFRNFSSSSAGVNLPSSLKVSPSTTPTASSPQDDIAGDDDSSTSSIQTPVSFSSGAPESPIMQRHGANQTIEVPVLDPLNAHKSSSGGSNFLHPPTILLEIPSTINKCLSPIRELPTPLPSPIPSPALTPIMRRSAASSSVEENSDDRISIEIPNISINCSDLDDDDDDVHCPDIAIDPQAEDGLILEEAAAMQHCALYKNKQRLLPLGQSAPEKSTPEIIINVEAPSPLVIPTLTIQTPSPTHQKPPTLLLPGSPPPHRSSSVNESNRFQFPSPKMNRKMLKDFEKPTSLDLPSAPPLITITCNMSEVESDNDSSISPATKGATHLGDPTGGMTYLSPFTMNTRGEHTASESNLSSSGYSSMASPGPSRCGSSNPLCPSEMEDGGPGGSHRRQSLTPVLKTTSPGGVEINKTVHEQRRGRSDSETLSDDPMVESNDEGIGTDHIDEKIDDGELKSAKELEVFMVNEGENCKTLLDTPIMPLLTTPRVIKCHSLEDTVDRLLPPLTPNSSKNSLQLPSIIVQCEAPGCEKHLSPMSSRSESPLSDKTSGMGRFSPQFYGRHKDLLPFTDSDGLYDFPSSDKVNVTTCTHHKKAGRKREKKSLRSCKTPSPTKTHPSLLQGHLDIPSKDALYKIAPPRKISPKRRIVRSQVVSSSSSSDSITSTMEARQSSSSPSPETIKWKAPVSWMAENCSKSLQDCTENPLKDIRDFNSSSLSKSSESTQNYYGRHQKIGRLRAISHQIRFLRRLEQSLKRKERTIDQTESSDSGDDSPRATSPLLQTKVPRVEIRKSNSIGKIQSNAVASNRFGKNGSYKKDLLLEQNKTSVKIIKAGKGYSE